MMFEWPLGVYVYDVDNCAIRIAQVRSRRLRQKQRCLEVASNELVPLLFVDAANRCWIEAGRAVDEAVQTPAPSKHVADEQRQTLGIQQVRLKGRRRISANAVEPACETLGLISGTSIVDRNTRAVLVQACHNSRANSSGRAGDENNFVVECLCRHGSIHKDFIAHMQYEQPTHFPQPDKPSAEHSGRVQEHIGKIIESAGGQISFAEFMHEALYAPGLGYYSAGSMKFGAQGDFVTAPEISPVFGRVLARQCAEVLGSIKNSEVLEFGAGSGRLAVDMLSALDALNMLPAAYKILEVSPDLADRQKKRLSEELPHLVDRVQWISDLPKGFEGVIVANEVLDALPVERFARRSTGVFQQCVSTDGNKFVWTEKAAPDHLAAAVEAIEADIGQALPEGYKSEVSTAATSWIADLAGCLKHGAVFLFDYGVSRREYYAPDRTDGWLRCHFRHHAHNNPLIHAGIQDLTAWVDFSSIAGAAEVAGLDILGYQAQSQFLLGGGLEIEMQGFTDLPTSKQVELSGQIKTLTLPGEMGENFKCIALGRGDINTPTAFHFADRTQTL